MKGLIVKGIGGFYYVNTPDGVVEAKGRGIFKKDGITLSVGDWVDVDLLPDHGSGETKGVIEKIYPRKNFFERPPIANIDCFAVTFAVTEPKPNFPVIDKFLINAELHGIEPIICINKADLASKGELAEISAIYSPIYKVITISTLTGEGLEEFKTTVAGKKTALAGPSGVGKSSIINAVHPRADMEVGAISQKNLRGKHTTRHVEIFEIEGGGLLFDTPGFTSFETGDMDPVELRKFYPELREFEGQCKFDDCTHRSEPDCAVTKALSEGKINPMRYRSYLANFEELKKKSRY